MSVVKQLRTWHWPVTAVAVFILSTASAFADGPADGLNYIFDYVLEDALQLSPGNHANHFLPSQVASSQKTIDAISNFIGTNVSTFPISSTATGLTFDFSSGVPVPIRTSAGPIFAERARTLGKAKLNVGANVSYLNLSRVRGVNTDDITVNMFHQDVASPGLGDVEFEYDYITLDMNLDLDAVVFATYATYGITDRIDVGIAVPVVRVSMTAEPWAQMNSYTYSKDAESAHYFGGTSTDPQLNLAVPYVEETATGLGDIALRAKANFFQGSNADFAGLVEARLPTGDEDKFLGTGDVSIKLGAIVSGTYNGFNPHANLALNIRTSDLDRNDIELTFGYDQKLGDKLTIAGEWIGTYEIGDEISELQFPEPAHIGPNGSSGDATYVIPSTSIPSYSADNIINTAFGIKYTPTPNVLLLANLIFPINNGGLRSDVIPTIGVEFNL
ncbi:MAG: hypothetical protein Kow0074_14460 [Candidatus Zixiibacteriota bacterium]